MFPVRLETERLVLREFEPSDLDGMHLYAGDPEVVRYEIWGPNTRHMTAHFLSSVALSAQHAEPRTAYELAIELRGTGLVGGCGLRVTDASTRTADLGYVLAKRYWGNGYMPEAVTALLDFAFTTLGLHRVWAMTDARNARSIGVLEKVGMRREGLRKADRRLRTEWIDSCLFAILESEWHDRKSLARKTSAFPPFVQNPVNRISASSQLTDDVEGYVFDGADGSQAAFWTSQTDRVSVEHTHDFDEYVLVVQGRVTLMIGDQKKVLTAGEEATIPKGTRQRMAVAAGTRTIHVFGGKRARRDGEM